MRLPEILPSLLSQAILLNSNIRGFMKKRSNSTLRKITVLLFLFLELVGCNISTDLIGQNSKSEQVNLNNLLVSLDDLPPNWSFGGIGPGIDSDRGKDSIGISFYSDIFPKSTGCTEDIYRQKSLWLAKLDYQDSLSMFSTVNAPKSWDFHSEIANESNFSCKYYPNSTFPSCYWISRYDQIVIEFGCWLVPNRMTISEMERIVMKIDNMAYELIYP